MGFWKMTFLVLFCLSGVLACASKTVPKEPLQSLTSELPKYLRQPLIIPDWFEQFNDPILQGLINEAVEQNPDWHAIAARLTASTALASIDGRLPNLDLNVDNQRSDNNGTVSDTASIGLRLSWEIDLWGRLAQQRAANVWSAKASAADAQWARFSLSANVSKAWLTVLANHQQFLLNQQRQQNLQQSLELVEDGFSQGTREALDLYSARAELASGSANLHRVERAFKQSQYQLSRLLGRYPGDAINTGSKMPSVAALPPSQLSSILLERRPDVRAAQFNLAAQQARRKLAQKNRLPVFSLTAQTGYASDTLANAVDGKTPFWSALGNVTAPLFRGKALAAESERQASLYRAAVADFKSAALNAFQDALNTLNNEQTLYQEWRGAQQAATISEQAEQQALERYLSGLENFNTWLQSQRTAFDRKINVLELQATLLQNRVDLHLALGGHIPRENTTNVP